ncbi:MAG TPA: hypothetical protein VKJ65_03815 [Phycisphaerae bacterium]|nr:hypothetical protein [Phycisphaerae bacterium]
MITQSFKNIGLRPAQVLAIKRKARRMGLTPETYVRELIRNDLELDRKVQSSSLHKLAVPFQQALGHISDQELDHRVDIARTRHHRSSRRKH